MNKVLVTDQGFVAHDEGVEVHYLAEGPPPPEYWPLWDDYRDQMDDADEVEAAIAEGWPDEWAAWRLAHPVG